MLYMFTNDNFSLSDFCHKQPLNWAKNNIFSNNLEKTRLRKLTIEIQNRGLKKRPK